MLMKITFVPFGRGIKIANLDSNFRLMKSNVGSVDKIVRILLAITCSILYFTGTVSGTVGYLVLAVGGILLLTSLINFCPLYRLIGVSTCKMK